MQGRLKREERYRHSGRTGRKSTGIHGASTYSESVSGYLPSDAGVKTSAVNSQGDTCCSCGIGNAGPSGDPGNDGENGTSHQ